jgi:hypothetical protein
MREESSIQKEISAKKNLKPDIKDLIDKWIAYLAKPKPEITDIFARDGVDE